MSNEAWLSGVILRTALPDTEWTRLEAGGRPVVFSRGQTIFSRGTPGEHIYLIRHGRVEISVILADGQKAVLNQMGPGEVFGEIAALDGGPRSADAIAATDEVQLTAIGRAQVWAAMGHTSEAAVAVIRELCKRVRNASDMFEVKSEKSARVRLARSLLHLAAKWGRAHASQTVIHGFSQSDLGDMAGLARENVNRQLKAWEDQSLIRRDGEGLILLNADAIADQAQL